MSCPQGVKKYETKPQKKKRLKNNTRTKGRTIQDKRKIMKS